MNKRPTERFSSRVENYIKYRPSYPESIINLLKSECNLTKDSIIADVGSGTGILSRLLLQNGNRVFGIEPNIEMGNAGDRLLNHFPQFTSVAGTAEATPIDDHSVHMVAAGQAFHWFDREKARAEFARILKPTAGLRSFGTTGGLIRQRFSKPTSGQRRQYFGRSDPTSSKSGTRTTGSTRRGR